VARHITLTAEKYEHDARQVLSLIEIVGQLRQVSLRADKARSLSHTVEAFAERRDVSFSPHEIGLLLSGVEAVVASAEALREGLARIDRDRLTETDPIQVHDGELARVAEAQLATGAAEPTSIVLLAHLLQRESGWLALANALASGDVHEAWDTPVRRSLASFSGVSIGEADAVMAAARVGRTQTFADLDDHEAQALSRTLTAYARLETTREPTAAAFAQS
jgi:hypothetical protein